ncbi:hypothetical protein AALP_AAs57073U000100, partial [Arabis alpina]
GDSSKDDKFGSLSSDQNSLVEAGFTFATLSTLRSKLE